MFGAPAGAVGIAGQAGSELLVGPPDPALERRLGERQHAAVTRLGLLRCHRAGHEREHRASNQDGPHDPVLPLVAHSALVFT